MDNPFSILERQLNRIERLAEEIKAAALIHSTASTTNTEPFGNFSWLCDTCNGIPPSTLRIKSAKGQIPGTKKVGRRVLYEKIAVLNWLHAHPNVTPTDAALIEQAAEFQVSTRIAKRVNRKAP